jgi:beta-phosphoglucomutase-like phosphatase (HAD superfamily)
VDARRHRLENGELSPEDFQIKNAAMLLERLVRAGVTLHLASGTDEADVRSEAQIMGYADRFAGGIHGSVGDLKIEAKRVVMQRILGAPGIKPSEVIVFGDGPVEIREGVKHGAFTIGVASDEVRRHGLDLKKRTRLIRAGADLIVPDYSQCDALLNYLGISA